MLTTDFRIMRGAWKNITLDYAKIEEFFYLQRKKIGFFGKVKWIDFKVITMYGMDAQWERPEFKTLKLAQKYLKDLKVVLK
ncbi:hypothetical protein LCGC14_2736910 [marine sediment metagenome]|uniref:Uncharacterized protein n=1 Tax=marine sediment metagenome TaxID=412755 RepID=A0A0F8Z5K3_9ZZZZ